MLNSPEMIRSYYFEWGDGALVLKAAYKNTHLPQIAYGP